MAGTISIHSRAIQLHSSFATTPKTWKLSVEVLLGCPYQMFDFAVLINVRNLFSKNSVTKFHVEFLE